MQAYLASPDRVGWKAYQSVYTRCSERAAQVAWSRLLTAADFKARHDELFGRVTERAVSAAVMSLEEVLAELSKLGRSSIKKTLVRGDDTGEVIASIDDIPDEDAASIQELTVETYVEGTGDEAREVKRVRVKLHSKPAALAELRRHLAPQRHELTGKDGGPIKTEDVTPISDLEAARRVAFLLTKAARAKPAPAKRKG